MDPGRLDVSQFVRFAIEIADRECVLTRLDFFQFIGSSPNSDAVAVAGEPI
jgi:hypothetical protein